MRAGSSPRTTASIAAPYWSSFTLPIPRISDSCLTVAGRTVAVSRKVTSVSTVKAGLDIPFATAARHVRNFSKSSFSAGLASSSNSFAAALPVALLSAGVRDTSRGQIPSKKREGFLVARRPSERALA